MDRQTGSWERQNLRMGPAWSRSVYRLRLDHARLVGRSPATLIAHASYGSPTNRT
jgi:hypothetical protein